MQAKLWLHLPAARWALLLLISALSCAGAIAQSETPDQPPEAIAPRPSTSLPPLDRPFLKLGSQGSDVSEVQALLRLLGYYTGTVDGVYSESTAAAVSNFQKSAGLTADGIVGPATWQRLLPSSSQAIALTDTRSPVSATSFPQPTPSQSAPPTTPQPATSDTRPAPSDSPSASPAAPETPSATPETAPREVTLPILRRGDRGPAVIQLQERLKAINLYPGEVDGIFGEGTESAVEAAQKDAGLTADGVVGPATWQALLRRQ